MLPEELIDQALGLMLSGVGNTLAIHSNRQWIWPYWVEKQQNSADPDFIPTGVNVLTTNLSHRNWTTLALKGATLEAMVDPVGMMTPKAFGWSLLPYLRHEQELFAPPRLGSSVEQELTETEPIGIETCYHISKDVSWKVSCHPICHEGGEWLEWKMVIENTSSLDQNFVIGMAVRPYNMLTMGPIHELKVEGSSWKVNGKRTIELETMPDRCHISDRQGGDPMLEPSVGQNTTQESRSGILSGVMEWNTELQSKGIKELTGRVKMSPKAKVRKNEGISEKEITISWPLASHQKAFDSVSRRYHVFDDGLFYTPGSFFYHHHWIRDSAYMMMADLNLGRFSGVTRKIDYWMKKQGRNGVFNSQKGEWDSTGQVLFMVSHACKRMGTPELLKKHHRALEKATKWVFKFRHHSKGRNVGLLPAGLSAEHFGPNDQYFWDNIWCLSGVESWLREAVLISEKRALYENQALAYREDLLRAMNQAIETQGEGALPCSPSRRFDSAAIGNMVSLYPLRLFRDDLPWVKNTVDRLFDEHVKEGLFYQDIIHTGFNPYLSLQLAMVMMSTHDPRYLQILEAVIEAGGKTYSWPEAIHPHTKGGCMGDGDHGWVQAEVINLMRDMVVQEKDNQLQLALGAAQSWFNEGKPLKVENAPIDGGRLSYSLKKDHGEWRFHWKKDVEETLILWEPLDINGGNRRRIEANGPHGNMQWRDWNELASH